MNKNGKHTLVSILTTLAGVWAAKNFPAQVNEVTVTFGLLLNYLFHLPVTNGDDEG